MLVLETTSALYTKRIKYVPERHLLQFIFRLIFSKALQNLKTVWGK